MEKLSEGPRRLCLVIGLLLVAAWVLFAAFASEGFRYMNHWQAWAFFAGGIIVFYWLPASTYRTYRWVRNGFSSSQ